MDTTMELDDLKLAWKTLDARLQQQNALQLAELHDRRIGRVLAKFGPGKVADCSRGAS